MKLSVPARAAFVVLASCACAAPLLGEGGAPSMRVVISNASALPLRATVYEDDFDCFGTRAAAFDKGVAVIDVPAKAWATVAFGYTRQAARATDTCAGVGSFRAEAAHEYRVDVSASSGTCGMRVTQRPIGSDGPPMPVDLAPRRPAPAPAGSPGPWCLADARFQGSTAFAAARP